MALQPSWGEAGDALITNSLSEMFDFANHTKAAALSSADALQLTNVLMRRIHEAKDPDISALGESVNKASWTEFACSKINCSAYDPCRDEASKLVDALKITALTKQEYDIYKSDFDLIDKDRDGAISDEEVTEMLKQQLQRDPTTAEVKCFIAGFDRDQDGKISFEEYMIRLCGKYELYGLTDEEAMEGFLAELDKVPPGSARAALAEGDFKGKATELAAFSDTEVLDAFKKQSLEVWATMADDPGQQGEMLAEVAEKLEKMGPEAAKIKKMIEGL